MIEAVFISDLHLNPNDSTISTRFNDFISWAAKNTKSLYILGDFFHVWPGDDFIDSWSYDIAMQLSSLASKGINLYYMHGNRDFLLNGRFAKLAGFTIAALDHTFDALGNRAEKYDERIRKVMKADGMAIENSILRHLPPLIILKDEILSLSTVTSQTAAIMSQIEAGKFLLNVADDSSIPLFNKSELNQANGLYVHASQLDSYRQALTNQIIDSITELDRLQDKALVLATHRVTALGGMILFPSLIFGFFGQNFFQLPNNIYLNNRYYKNHSS